MMAVAGMAMQKSASCDEDVKVMKMKLEKDALKAWTRDASTKPCS